MHERGNICCGDANARIGEKIDESTFKFKEVLHCRKISVVLVYDFQSSKIAVIAEHLNWLRIIIFVDREAETDDRREEGRREIRIYEGQLEGEFKKPPAV